MPTTSPVTCWTLTAACTCAEVSLRGNIDPQNLQGIQLGSRLDSPAGGLIKLGISHEIECAVGHCPRRNSLKSRIAALQDFETPNVIRVPRQPVSNHPVSHHAILNCNQTTVE